MSMGWWAAASLLTNGVKGIASLSKNLANSIDDSVQSIPSQAVRKGILGPWDKAPSPQAGYKDFWDYRGLAKPVDITLESLDFPLGFYINPKRWQIDVPIGLSSRVVNEHTIVLGPTRSGKTVSIIVPWIYSALKNGYSVVSVDVKGHEDLILELKDFANHYGSLGASIYAWDYTNPSKSVHWNWISDLHTDGERNAAIEAICGRPSPNDPNKFFHQSAIKYLRGLLELSSSMQKSFNLTELISLINDQSMLKSLVNNRTGFPGTNRLSELCGMNQSEFVKHTMELKTHLETLDINGFHSVTNHDGFTFDAFINSRQPSLAVVTAPVADGALAESACSLYLGQFIQRVLNGFRMQRRPILLVIDEAPRIQNRINLGSTLSLVASAGVSILMAAQDISQFHEDTRDEILANCGSMICLPRVSKNTTDYFINRLGESHFSSKSHNISKGRTGNDYVWSESLEKAPVLSHREISFPHKILGSWPAFVHSPSISAKPFVVDLSRRDLV